MTIGDHYSAITRYEVKIAALEQSAEDMQNEIDTYKYLIGIHKSKIRDIKIEFIDIE